MTDYPPLVAATADICGRLDLFPLLSPAEQDAVMADAAELVAYFDIVIGDLEDNDPGWRGVTYPIGES